MGGSNYVTFAVIQSDWLVTVVLKSRTNLYRVNIPLYLIFSNESFYQNSKKSEVLKNKFLTMASDNFLGNFS